ncbi:MAG: hypothetical protein EON96_21320, partial [Caulobacteraceae bacterium]
MMVLKKLFGAVLFALALTLLAAMMQTPSSAHAESVVERHGRLQVQGNRIVDAHGDPVALHGMSLFWSQWQPQFYNRRAIQWLADDWHVTVVRAAIAVPAGGYLRHPQAQYARAVAAID